MKSNTSSPTFRASPTSAMDTATGKCLPASNYHSVSGTWSPFLVIKKKEEKNDKPNVFVRQNYWNCIFANINIGLHFFFQSTEPLLTCEYYMPQDIQVYLIFFQYLNLRLLVDLTHKVTTKIGPSKFNFILVTTLTFKISIEACTWHYLSPNSRIKFLYLTIFYTKICTTVS